MLEILSKADLLHILGVIRGLSSFGGGEVEVEGSFISVVRWFPIGSYVRYNLKECDGKTKRKKLQEDSLKVVYPFSY